MTTPSAAMRSMLVGSGLREADFGTPAAIDRRMLVRAPAVRPALSRRHSTPILAGPDPIADDAAVRYEARWEWRAVRPDDLAWALAYAVGTPTSEAVDGSATRHTFVPETSCILPSFTAEEIVAPGSQDRYTGGTIRRIGLIGSSADRFALAIDVLFAARDAGNGAADPVSGEPVWAFNATRVWIGSRYSGSAQSGTTNLADAVEITRRTVGFAAKINNSNAVDDIIPFYSNEISCSIRGDRTFGLSLSVEIEDDDALRDDDETGAMKAVEIGWSGGLLAGDTSQQYGVHLIWPRVVIESMEPRDGIDGRLTLDIGCRVLADPDYGPFIGLVWNRVDRYAA